MLVSKTKAALRKHEHEDFAAKSRSTETAVSQRAEYSVRVSSEGERRRETEDDRRDEEASSQMVSEGGPG